MVDRLPSGVTSRSRRGIILMFAANFEVTLLVLGTRAIYIFGVSRCVYDVHTPYLRPR